MKDLIPLDMALDIPKVISAKISIDNFNNLLAKDLCEEYDTKTLKKEIVKKFQKYREVIYMMQWKDSLGSNYRVEESLSTKHYVTDKMTDLVANNIEKQKWLTKFYKRLESISFKLTNEEIKYLVGTFFKGQSEEVLSENMGICRNTLRKIKKSCLVKMWIEMEDL